MKKEKKKRFFHPAVIDPFIDETPRNMALANEGNKTE